MRLLLQGETELKVDGGGEGLSVEAEDADVGFSPLHMLAASLATCTYAVLLGWAHAVGLDHGGLAVATRWEYHEDPYRVGRFDIDVIWPALPAERRAAALRVASECTVKHTLAQPPSIEIGLEQP